MYVIGELINGTYSKVARAIQAKDGLYIKALALSQVDEGADALDINCGPASRDEIADMRWLVETIREKTAVTLSLDSAKPQVIEAGLQAAGGQCIINSTSADRERLQTYIPLAKKYNAALIALTMDKKGVPQDKDRRLELAAEILAFVQESDFSVTEVYLDPILPPVNVGQSQLVSVLEAIREFRQMSTPAAKTVLGASNISQGSKERSLLNRTFLVMAESYGLDAAILDPLDRELMDALITAEMVLNKSIYCDSYIDAYRKSRKS